MNTKTIAFLAIAAVVMSVAAMGAVMAEKKECTTIQDGTITYGRVGDPSTDIIPIGYDQWGYNYQAHMFNGKWCDYQDCNNDGKLDRGYSCDPVNAGSSGCPGAWLTNHEFGTYVNDNGETCSYTYFCKIVAAPADAYVVDDSWYEADGTEIGPVIWGAFATIEEVENDPCAGLHGLQYRSPASPGFGCYIP
jgi:hypothetical protein